MRALTVITLMLIGLQVQAQVVGAGMTKLVTKYDAGEYEWVLKKAEALMEDDNAKKDPETYMWAAMCNLVLFHSDDPKLKETYRGGLRDALKYTAKAASKDKEDRAFISAQKDFITDLKRQGIALALTYVQENDMRKANHIYKQIMTFDPADVNVQFAKAITDLKMNNTAEAEKLIAEALPIIENSYRDLSFVPDPVSSPLLRDAVVYYIDHLAMHNLADSARHAAFVGRIIFPLDEEIKQKAASLE
jgi:tetratricopeptide (TPR) repeat protein